MRVPALLFLLWSSYACNTASHSSGTSGGQATDEGGSGKSFVEGKDYVVLERMRVLDPSGFGQPVEAYSILVPKGWRSQGGITWEVGNTCMAECVRNRVTATSPDGRLRLDIYPLKQWDWYDDPMMLQTMQQQAANPVFRRCNIAPPMDAAAYLRGPLAQEMGAEITAVQPDEGLNGALRQQAEAGMQQLQAAGVANVEFRPSAVVGTLHFPDGSSGVALCSVSQTVAWMPDFLQGGQKATYQCQATQSVSLRCPAGQEAEARKLLSTVMSSFRVNPDWQKAVQQVFTNVARVEQQETAKRAAYWRKTQEEISDLQQRTWESHNESSDRIAEQWGQVLRGVETWSDASGQRVELSAGYNEAWSRPDGTYILSNDPLFDPNVVLKEDWKKLEKGR